MAYLLLAAYCLGLVLVPTEHFNSVLRRGVAVGLFYLLCLLCGRGEHQDALAHKVQIGTEQVGHGGFLADDYYTTEPIYSTDDSWLLLVFGAPIVAVLLLRFLKRPARLHPIVAAGYLFYLIGSILLPDWLNPW
jgi:hypothetical protein